MRSTVVTAALGLGLFAFGSQASAQIIATSIPKEVSAPAASGAAGSVAPAASTEGGKVAFHVMASPLAKWDISSEWPITDTDSVHIKTTPNSDFLLAGELALAATENLSLGFGGWYNKIGEAEFDVSFAGYRETVAADLGNIWEVHAAAFYKSIGVQGSLIGYSGGDNEGSDTPKDKAAYLVFKKGTSGKTPVTFSVGGGAYFYGAPDDFEAPDPVFTAFAAAGVQVYKGLGIDASYWYIGKSEGLDNDAGRFMVGVGYTFSR